MVQSIASKQLDIIIEKIDLQETGLKIEHSSLAFRFINSIVTGNYTYEMENFYDCEKNNKDNTQNQSQLCEFLIRPKDSNGEGFSFSQGLSFLYEMNLHKEIDLVLLDGAMNIAKATNKFPFSFNISMESTSDPEFWANTKKLMEEHGITPDMVVFEILEDHIEHHMDFSHLTKYNDLGYRFAIDDFKPCNRDIKRLNILSEYIDIEFVKLDGEVISASNSEKETEIYITNTIDFIKNLLPDTHILAEYVGDIDHMFKLKNLGVNLCQGHGLQDEFKKIAHKEMSLLSRVIDELTVTVLVAKSYIGINENTCSESIKKQQISSKNPIDIIRFKAIE